VASVPDLFDRPDIDRPDIDRLWVLHRPHHTGIGSLSVQNLAQPGNSGVPVDTCMRQLLIGTGPRPLIDPAHTTAMQLYSGISAYGLLLEIVTGLRSAVRGETNVYGQFRRAWQTSLQSLPEEVTRPVSPFIEALFSDARRIRQQHLQGVGGNSWGSLARRLLAPARGARVLFVGTGELARSMLPLFRAAETAAWNHRPVKPPSVDHWFSTAQADVAARWAEHVIFTTPADAEHDAGWQARLRSGNVRSLLHLGRRRSEALHWSGVETAFDLDDILGAAEARANVASLQLARARAACAELADARFPVAKAPARAGTMPDKALPLLYSAQA
jgi:hypothetical protein